MASQDIIWPVAGSTGYTWGVGLFWRANKGVGTYTTVTTPAIPALSIALMGRNDAVPLSVIYDVIVHHFMDNGFPLLCPGVANPEGRLYELLQSAQIPPNLGSAYIRFFVDGPATVSIG